MNAVDVAEILTRDWTGKTQAEVGSIYGVSRSTIQNIFKWSGVQWRYSTGTRAGGGSHCMSGHAFDSANTSILPDGRRRCRACHNARRRGGVYKKKLTVYPFVFRISSDPGIDLLLAVSKAVPKTLQEPDRQDVCQSLLLRVLSGEIEMDEIRDHIQTEIRGAFSARSREVSLDAPFGYDGKKTLGQWMGVY